MKIGSHNLSVRFWLDGTETRYEVLAGDASIVERRLFSEAWGTDTDVSARVP